MTELRRVSRFDFVKKHQVATILNACGKDMAERYDLHHWDNPFIKSLLITEICAMKNNVYLLFDDTKPVATFMTRIQGDTFHFEKLGTLPTDSGKGLGTMCLSMIEEMAKKAGCKQVVMEVYKSSTHAIAFYEHRGYSVIGTVESLKYQEVKMGKSV